MFLRAMPLLFCGVLAACSDPLAGLDRLNEVDLSQQDASAAALPTEDEIQREGYFGTPAASGEAPASLAAPVAKKPAARAGLFGLFQPPPFENLPKAVAEPSAENLSAQEDSENTAVAVAPKAQPAPTGFFSRLLARAPAQQKATPNVADTRTTETDRSEPVELASLAPTPAPAPARRGVFGRAGPQSTATTSRRGPDALDVPHGTNLPFGEVARSCGTNKNQLGRKVEKAPAKGYTLYDSQPNTAAPRTFYITGFSDGCPRQLTAANVLLGSAALYERLHYGPGGQFLPVGATDEAYEKVKRRVCGAGRNKPCGGKIKKMEQSTFFVTAYHRFGDANSWSELLIHDGQVLASAIKRNN